MPILCPFDDILCLLFIYDYSRLQYTLWDFLELQVPNHLLLLKPLIVNTAEYSVVIVAE